MEKDNFDMRDLVGDIESPSELAMQYHSADRSLQMQLAHRLVAKAKRDGLLIPQPCEKCGAEKVSAHHDDYDKPLDVRWLCNKHHMGAHHGKWWRGHPLK